MLNQKDMCGGLLERTSTAAAETIHTFQYLYDDFGALNDLRNGYIFALSHRNMDQVMDPSPPQLCIGCSSSKSTSSRPKNAIKAPASELLPRALLHVQQIQLIRPFSLG